jgi:hypothetical protein
MRKGGDLSNKEGSVGKVFLKYGTADKKVSFKIN